MIRESDWTVIVDKIQRRQCTPFLGAGLSEPHVPLGSEFSARLAEEFRYPLTDVWNLPRVAQYIATSYRDSQFAKGQVADLILACERRPPDFSDPAQPHRVLADLRLPLYLTTNYDRFMTRALEMAGPERPRGAGDTGPERPRGAGDTGPERPLGAGDTGPERPRGAGDTGPEVATRVCRWNYETRLGEEELAGAPTSERPLVYHLHGAADNIASMLLTEDDYVDFLMEAQADLTQVVPPPIQEALGTTSLLFVGYSLNDWNFRVLMRSVMRKINKSSKRMNVSVQLPPGDDSIAPDRRDEAEGFLCDYLGTEQVTVHWGGAREFLTELRQRWEAAREPQVV